jgi:hypothetical protein
MSGYVKDHKTIIGIFFGLLAIGGLLYLVFRKKSGSDGSGGSGGSGVTTTRKDKNHTDKNHTDNKHNDNKHIIPPLGPSDKCFISKKNWNNYCLHVNKDDIVGSPLKCAKYLDEVMSENIKNGMSAKDINDELSQYPLYNVVADTPIGLENINYDPLCAEANQYTDSDCQTEYNNWANGKCAQNNPTNQCDSNTDYYILGAKSFKSTCTEDCDNQCLQQCEQGSFYCLPAPRHDNCETACYPSPSNKK